MDAFVSRMDKDLDRYTGILLEAQRNMKIHADRLRKSVEFKIGDMVLFKQSRLEKAAGTHARYAKLRPKSIGPFTIVKFIGHNVVELDNPIPGLNSKNINVSFLSPYNRPDEIDDVEIEDDILNSSNVENVDMLYHYNGDVKLDPRIFHHACTRLQYFPNIDMFASRTHHQLDDYCSLQPDSEAHHQNCFELNWSEYFPYLNPPWEEIFKTLLKVKRDKATCLLLIPFWESATWFTLWKSLCVRYWIVSGPLYLDENGELRPTPKWKSCFSVVDGSDL